MPRAVLADRLIKVAEFSCVARFVHRFRDRLHLPVNLLLHEGAMAGDPFRVGARATARV
jgi:hypothetical protein